MPIVVIISDRENTHKLTLNAGDFTLGRSGSCHVSIQDPMVSGKHCSVGLSDDNRVIVKDLNSSNGTYLNGNKITETSITIDDEVTIGEVRMWIDPNSLTAQERTKFSERATQKTKLKFIDLGSNENSSSDLGIKQPQTNSDIAISTDVFEDEEEEDAEEESRPAPKTSGKVNISVETISNKELKRMQSEKANRLKISRQPDKRQQQLKTKNEEKESATIGSKLKGLFKK